MQEEKPREKLPPVTTHDRILDVIGLIVLFVVTALLFIYFQPPAL